MKSAEVLIALFQIIVEPPSDPAPNLTLLANSLRRAVKPFKSRNPSRGEQVAIEPGNETDEIDRRSNAKMLQMGFRHSQIPRTTQIKGTHSLRDGRLYPGTPSIPLLEGFSALDLPGDLECYMLRLWPDRQGSSLIFVRRVDTKRLGEDRGRNQGWKTGS
jgi:hypothetical protein